MDNTDAILERLNRIERLVAFLLICQNQPVDEVLGPKYKGYNAVSALERYWKDDPRYLGDLEIPPIGAGASPDYVEVVGQINIGPEDLR